MAQNKILNSQPVALAATVGTIFAPGAAVAQTNAAGYTFTGLYAIIRHIRVVNTSSSAVTFQMFKGASGGTTTSTSVVGNGYSVAANSAFDWYGIMRLDVADFLTGLASTGAVLVVTVEGEMGVAG